MCRILPAGACLTQQAGSLARKEYFPPAKGEVFKDYTSQICSFPATAKLQGATVRAKAGRESLKTIVSLN